jgi:PAS domain S-box-containing protein
MTPDHNRQTCLRIKCRMLACTLLVAACLCLIPAGPWAADSPDRPRRILVIPSYNFDYKGIQWFLQGVMAEFAERKPFQVVFSLENMQLSAHPSDRAYMDKMAASLKIKYSLEKPDLIIVQYKQALEFMERYGKEIFGDLPVVFAGLTVEGYVPDRLPHQYTGIVASFSAIKNIELILHNHPNVRKIYVVGGVSRVEHSLVQEAIKEGAPYRGKVDFIALSDITFPALLTKLGNMGDDSAVMYQALQLDAAGKVFVPAQAAIEIARAASVPVYGMLDTYMGSGITGGFLINHDSLGRRAAEIAIQWLRSGVMPDTRVISEPIGSYRFDWRQLKRWRIEEDSLPSGSRIEYKVFSIWDSYKKEIVAGISLILLQTFLIMGLLRSRHRRIRTEKELRKSEERFRTTFERSTIGKSLTTPDGKFLRVNKAFADMLGHTIEEIQQISFAQITHPDDVAESLECLRILLADEQIGYRMEKRYIHKNGNIVWANVSTTLLRDEQKTPLYLITSIVDITDRKKVEERLRNTLESLRRAVGTTIQVMVSAVESRDPYTAGHQVRSAELARAIATEMGLPRDKIDGIRMAGSIHDIGKLSIPAEILSKPTKLSAIELSLIKEHANTGYEILKDVESPWPLAEIVHQHHERMDGSGYPRNLKGEEILMEARILIVADVVEAMSSHRPYRPGLGIDKALEEIEKNKGIFYDKAVADACLRLFREKGFKLERT